MIYILFGCVWLMPLSANKSVLSESSDSDTILQSQYIQAYPFLGQTKNDNANVVLPAEIHY